MLARSIENVSMACGGSLHGLRRKLAWSAEEACMVCGESLYVPQQLLLTIYFVRLTIYLASLKYLFTLAG